MGTIVVFTLQGHRILRVSIENTNWGYNMSAFTYGPTTMVRYFNKMTIAGSCSKNVHTWLQMCTQTRYQLAHMHGHIGAFSDLFYMANIDYKYVTKRHLEKMGRCEVLNLW